MENNPEAWFDYGEALFNTNQLEKALESLRKVLNLNPHHQRAQVILNEISEKGLMTTLSLSQELELNFAKNTFLPLENLLDKKLDVETSIDISSIDMNIFISQLKLMDKGTFIKYTRLNFQLYLVFAENCSSYRESVLFYEILFEKIFNSKDKMAGPMFEDCILMIALDIKKQTEIENYSYCAEDTKKRFANLLQKIPIMTRTILWDSSKDINSNALKDMVAKLCFLANSIIESEINMRNAVYYYEVALKISNSINPPLHIQRIEILNNLGIAWQKSKKFNQALHFFQEARKYCIDCVPNTPALPTTLNNIGASYQSAGNFEKAITFYKDALNKYKYLNNQEGVAETYNNLASVFWDCNRPEKARKYHQTSVMKLKKAPIVEVFKDNMKTFETPKRYFQLKHRKRKRIKHDRYPSIYL